MNCVMPPFSSLDAMHRLSKDLLVRLRARLWLPHGLWGSGRFHGFEVHAGPLHRFLEFAQISGALGFLLERHVPTPLPQEFLVNFTAGFSTAAIEDSQELRALPWAGRPSPLPCRNSRARIGQSPEQLLKVTLTVT